MPNNLPLTGDDFVDRLRRGPYRKNPNYNPKTKKGRSVPPIIADTSAGDLTGGGFTRTSNQGFNLDFSARSLGRDLESVERDEEFGISLSPYNTEEQLNVARAKNQGALTKIGNALMQAGVGEVLVGTFEGFGNIADGIINTFTRDNYGQNPWTNYWAGIHKDIRNKYQIYQRDPNSSWQLGDWGWWMNGLTNIATTASLMLPVAGWARALSYLGKVGKLGKLSNWASRGLARVAKAGKAENSFGAMRQALSKANRIERTINDGSQILGTAVLSRMGENYMEGKQVYDDVYSKSKENLENMSDAEFAKFLAHNPQFANMSKDDIAKEIARKSANRTFYANFAMILMDIPQFKALGKLWGKGLRRSSTASERIAAENARRTLAGRPAEELVKDNFINRAKEGIRYGLKNPRQSLVALDLGEGVEEMYQGIQSDKGMEIATKYFDPTMTPRTIASYLSDGSIWEQGFWGILGGVGFNAIGQGIREGGRKVEGLWNKKHMSADDYERWKRAHDKVGVEQINNITSKVDEYINNLRMIDEGKNPFEVLRDANTGQEIIVNGQMQNEEIDENQKQLLRDKTIKKFIDDTTMDAIDTGIFDTMKSVIDSQEFNQYLTQKGVTINGDDINLGQSTVSRMDEVADMYQNELQNVDALADTTNPFTTIATARNIVRNKMKLQDYNATLANIQDRINEISEDKDAESAYTEKAAYDMYKNQVENLLKQKAQLEKDYNDGNISKAAYTRRSRDIDNTIKVWNNWAVINTEKGSLDQARKNFENTLDAVYREPDTDYFDSFNKFLKNYQDTFGNYSIEPIDSVKELIDQRLEEEKRKNYTEAQIPINKQQYQDTYNEFARAMDEMEKKRAKDYMDTIRNYIENADDIDEAVDNLMHGRVNNKKLQDAFDYLQYGYQSMRGQEDMDARDVQQMMSDFNIDAAVQEAKDKRTKAEQRNQAAVDEGVEPPPANDNNQQEEQTDNDSPSTGQVKQSETTDTIEVIAQTEQANAAATETQPQPQIQRTDNANVDLGGGDDTLGNPMNTDRRADTLDESYDTPNLRAEIKARKYVMQVGFKNPKRLKDIADALANGDTTQRDKLLNEITDYLRGENIDINTARHIAYTSFVSTVNLFGTTTSNNGFKELAIQLAAGFSKKAAEKANDRKAVTALIDGSELDEIVDEFLTKYSELTKNKALSSGRTVINLESLFDYLLNNPDVSIETAMYIYDNLSKYIAKNDNKKYIFTGFNTAQGLLLNSKEFIDALKVNKAQHKDALKKMHISPIELAQRSSKRDSAEYRAALLAAVNEKPGTRILIEPAYITVSETLPNGKTNTRQRMSNLDIIVEYKEGNKTKRKKIGILRTVQNSSDGNLIYPISHQSGFRNEITTNNDNNNITLDCDFLFNAIINRTGEAGEQLWNDISEYYLTVRDIIDRRKSGKITFEDAKKKLDNAMSKEMANRIMNNNLIMQALFKDVYKFDKRVKDDNVSHARDISGKIASILFFGREDDVNDATNDEHNSFATDSATLANRYNMWKQEVKTNYEQTARFQDAIKKGETSVISKLNVRTNIIPNTTPVGTVNNIKDLSLRLDKTDPNYTPLVMVIGGRLKGLDGTDYGYAGPSIRDYSMGFVTYKDNHITYVSYFKNSPEIKNSPIAKAAKTEFVRLLKAQLSNIYRATGNTDEDAESARVHDENFRNIGTILKEMIGPGGLLRTGNIRVTYSNNSNTIQIYRYDPATRKNTPITVLYSYDSKGNRGNAITAYDAQGNKVTFNSINGTGNLTAETVNTWINYLADTVFDSVKFNRSKLAFDKNNNTTLFSNTNNGFDINLGGKNYHYRDYADFLVQNGAFETNIQADANGSFVKFVMSEGRITADTSIAQTPDVQLTESHAVSDMLYTSDRNSKRKTANTADILEATGVSKETIDILLKPIAGVPLVTKRITVSGDRENARFYYDKTDKSVHITPTGAFAINGNKSNAVRLILHENLHRHFNSSNVTHAERQRILTELQEVYRFTKQKFEEDYHAGKLNENFYKQTKDVFESIDSNTSTDVQMEEFLVECLTQAPFTRWLNDTDYTLGNANILGIPAKKKSILQKIVDIILNLLGVNDGNIKNNSILAREYVIMSRDVTLAEPMLPFTDNTGIAGQAVPARKTSPVEGRRQQTPASASPINTSTLDKGKAKVDEIEQYFGSRITRSDNFAEDHTYYLDGKTSINTSVTQKIHGKQDVGKYGVPASTLGNSADAAARAHFENNGEMPEDTDIPNVTDEQKEILAESMKTIEQMLNAKFGKGHYRVVTKEFPIGGTVEVNGEQKTIAGTMDMIVYTDKGEFWIFDFKTKRANKNANISPETLVGYKQQVNIYRQLIEANFPELKGKVHTGSLIKFNVEYPEPSDIVKYRANPNNSSQLQISMDGGNTYIDIQDALIDYTAPIIVDDINNTNVFIPVEEQDYGDTIGALPEPESNEPDLNNNLARPTITPPDAGNPEEDYTPEDIDDIDFDGEILEAATNEIQDNANSSVEIYAPAVVNDSADNAYGIKRVGSMKEFVDSFPVGYQPFIEQMIASNELNYTCQ